MRISNAISFGNSRINVVYFNDLHGSTKNLNSFVQAQDKFIAESKDVPVLTLCGGDMFLDTSYSNEEVAAKLSSRMDAAAAGNHDLEGGNNLDYLINKFSMFKKWLSANIFYTKQTSLSDSISKSLIIRKSEEEIGIIGVSPMDFEDLAFVSKFSNFIKVMDFDKTKKAVSEEVKKLESLGINKIFLLAHTGEKSKDNKAYYKEFAKIGGIDVIIGGHDHFETDKWEFSSRNEPVKIVSTGKSKDHGFEEILDIIGKMKLEFDDNGVLIKEKCLNEFEKIDNIFTETNKPSKDIIKTLNEPLIKENPLFGCCEIGNIVSDSNLWYANKHTKGKQADFAFVNAGTIRGNFDNKEVTMEDIRTVVPFTCSTLIKTTLTKKQIIDTLNWGVLSTSFGKVSPGMMQVSGLEYTVNPDLTVSGVHILDDDQSVKYNLDDFSDDKEFVVVYDVFLATGVAGLKDLKKDCENDKNIEFFDASRQDALYEYLTQNKQLKDYKKARIHKLV